MGNIAHAFKKINIEYTGVDVDPIVISYAQKEFIKYPNFKFINIDLRKYAEQTSEKYDFILFAGVLHHNDDSLSKELIVTSKKLLAENGKIVIAEALRPDEKDNWFIHLFMKTMEQGKYLRREEKLKELVEALPGLKYVESESHYQGATPFSFPKSCRFAIHVLEAVK